MLQRYTLNSLCIWGGAGDINDTTNIFLSSENVKRIITILLMKAVFSCSEAALVLNL